MRARYLSGLYPLEDFAPLLRAPAGRVGMDRADRWNADVYDTLAGPGFRVDVRWLDGRWL